MSQSITFVLLMALISASDRDVASLEDGSTEAPLYQIWSGHACAFEGLRDGSITRGDVWAGYETHVQDPYSCERSCALQNCTAFMFRRTTEECWLYRKHRPKPTSSPDFDCGRLGIGHAYRDGNRVLLEDGNRRLTVDDVAFGYELLTNVQAVDARLFGVHTSQDPLTLSLLQEQIWDLQPDLIVEIGTECGGLSSILAELQHLRGLSNGIVVTIDISPQGYAPWEHADCAQRRGSSELWERHTSTGRLQPFLRNTARWGCPCEGTCTCTDEDGILAAHVAKFAGAAQVVLVIDDANHFKDDVIQNFALFAPFVTKGSLYIVADTRLDRLCETAMRLGYPVPNGFNPGEHIRCDYYIDNGPAAAVGELLSSTTMLAAARFKVDRSVERTVLQAHPGGWLRAF